MSTLPMNGSVNEGQEIFNKHSLNSMMQRAKQLQMQGAQEDNNPELAHIMKILRSIQQPKKPPQLVATDNQLQTVNNNKDTLSTSSFTKVQLATLRHQIMAFKLISKNLPIPIHLQQAILASAHQQTIPSSRHNETNTTSVPANNNNHAANNNNNNNNNTGITNSAEEIFNAYASPYNLIKRSTQGPGNKLRPHHQRLLVPSITPLGIDTYSLISERERRIQSRIRYRLEELEKLPGNITDNTAHHLWFPENESSKVPSVKLRAAIELKSLRLLSKQKKLREEILQGVNKSTMLSTSADRLAYRRMKKQSLREARMTEKIERQQRLNREHREKQKHMDYLQSICDHGRNLVLQHNEYNAKQAKLGRAVLQFHIHVEKEEQKKAERISKERIQALKNDDEEAYMKLIDQAKDTRLTQLLKQTGEFLSSLTLAVVDQQNDSVHGKRPQDFALPGEEEDEKVDYFQVTHRIKESVHQPSILVGGTLKDYQVKGLQWMVSLYNNHLNGILADEMGLGKTIQTISLITYLIEQKNQMGPFLIIVPLSTLPNWTLEFEKWAPSVSKIVYKGNPQVRRTLQANIRYGDFQVLLTTFEYIIKDRPILSKIKWAYMIMDEGHRMKNTNSKLTVVLRQYYSTRYRLILTGTPLQNNLPELWALLNFILPKIFKSVKNFEEWFNTPFSNQGVQDKVALNEEEQLLIIKRLHKVLRPFLLRRLKKDVESELPDKVERVIKCKLSPLQSKIYSQLKKYGVLFTSGSDKGSKAGVKGLNNTIMQLRKVCNHPFVFEEVENEINPQRTSNELLYRVSGKFELLDRMLPKLARTGHRVLIFFQMTQIMSIMEDFLAYRGVNYLRLDGSTKADDRSQLLKLFNAPNSPYTVFLLSTRAGGLGLNLQTADTVIIFDSDWNPHQDLQAQDRAHRIGQTKEVRIFRLVSANSVEESILARANYKLDIDGKVIQAGKFDNRSTEEDREAFLRSLLEDKNDDQTNEDDEEGMDDEELNQILQRSEDELEVFAKIDAEREKEDMEWWSRVGKGKKIERLIQESELPDIYQIDDIEPIDPADEGEYGRGQRVRDSVRYDDGLTEEQWLNALEDENVDLDELIAKKEARRHKRLAKMLGNGEESDSSNGNSQRGRRKREASTDSEVPRKAKRGKKSAHNNLDGPDTVSPRVRKQITQVFEQVYQAVLEAREEDEDTYRDLSDLFMTLVSKKEYPTYYTMIKNPISMDMIKKRMNSPYYRNIQQFKDDFHLMFDNARIFNEEGSIVYEDANTLQSIVDAKLQELCPQGVLPTQINIDN